jgi:predicted AlkP superfamily phosphohydrolase/phosphomutase
MNRRRVLLFGLDGATWRILDPMIQRGHLPHLGAMREAGAHGVLSSTVPPVTPAAWTTFQTGLLPANHGLFDFSGRNKGSYHTHVVSSREIVAPTLWELTSQAGKRAVVVNVPLTYPPKAVNGAVVTGMLTPGVTADLTYPADLKEQLLAAVPDYRVLVPQTEFNIRGWEPFVRASEATVRARAKAFRFLLDQVVPDWDVAMLHFQETDTLQHAGYPWLDPTHPDFSVERYRQGLAVYRAIDEEIGELVARLADQSTLVLALSDHGHQAVSKMVNVNVALLRAGLLQRADVGGVGVLGSATRAVVTALLRLDRWNLNKRLLPRAQRRRLVERVTDAIGIDWEQTQAYMIHGWVYAYVNVNMRGREDKGTVDPADYASVRQRAADVLLSMRDPETGEPIVEKVLTREEAFDGVRADEAPDLIAVPCPGYEFSSSILQSGPGLVRPNLVRRDHLGTHSMDGVLLAHGRDVASGGIDGANLVDLFPTVLAWLGIPIPAYAEGDVLQALFQQPLQVSIDRDATLDAIRLPGDRGFTEDDERVVEERLRSLGYL